MAINRYRLRHLAKLGDSGAQKAETLLQKPDRLISLILLGNIAVHSAATAIVTFITLNLFGNGWIAISTGILSVTILILGETAPKTLSALYPEKVALFSAHVYQPVLWITRPVVIAIGWLSIKVLNLFGVSAEEASHHNISPEELRSVVAESGKLIPARHQKMLLSLLDLEETTVEDIMVPRNEIVGIDITEDWDTIRDFIIHSSHTRLPIFNGSIDDLKGIVHLRRVVRLAAENNLNPQSLLALAKEPFFIPEGTSLNQQLLNFQDNQKRIAFVVDEYGDIQGLVTLEDILEEIVGEFTSDPATGLKHVHLSEDGSALIAGRVTVRNINRNLKWDLPLDGPKTLNGLLLQALQAIPQPGQAVFLGRYRFDIQETRASVIKTVRARKN